MKYLSKLSLHLTSTIEYFFPGFSGICSGDRYSIDCIICIFFPEFQLVARQENRLVYAIPLIISHPLFNSVARCRMGELHSPYIAFALYCDSRIKGAKAIRPYMLVRCFVKGAKAIRPYVLVRYFVEGRKRFAHTIMPLFLWFAIKKRISLH